MCYYSFNGGENKGWRDLAFNQELVGSTPTAAANFILGEQSPSSFYKEHNVERIEVLVE